MLFQKFGWMLKNSSILLDKINNLFFCNSVIKSRIKSSFNCFNPSNFFEKYQELNGAYRMICFFFLQNCYTKILFDCNWKFSKMNSSLIWFVVAFPKSVFLSKVFRLTERFVQELCALCWIKILRFR